jgi:hypothetical protein
MSSCKHCFRLIHKEDTIIYQTDIDEIPDPHEFMMALTELNSGKCDAIWGTWRDRVTSNGKISTIKVENSMRLEDQFPLRCQISSNIVHGMTKKTIAYRGIFRVRYLSLRCTFLDVTLLVMVSDNRLILFFNNSWMVVSMTFGATIQESFHLTLMFHYSKIFLWV